MDNPVPASKSFAPASNVTANGIITSFVVMTLETLTANGIVIPDQVMIGLPSIVAVMVPYLWDLWSGENKPKQ